MPKLTRAGLNIRLQDAGSRQQAPIPWVLEGSAQSRIRANRPADSLTKTRKMPGNTGYMLHPGAGAGKEDTCLLKSAHDAGNG